MGRYERDHGLGVEGVSGASTEKALAEEYTPVRVALSWGDYGSAVMALQMSLAKRGYYHGPFDGVFNIMTGPAVMNFQEQEGLAIDAIVGPRTIEACYVLRYLA